MTSDKDLKRLVTLYALFGGHAPDLVPDLRAIAEWLATWAEREFGWDHNLIARPG
ncbi:hypothetical protein [Streptomyces sp. NPDC057199]|uniref:hypothetical protein n=1 Tax=Streptomyces sp. NPDC057199 TaxID=3346047 RepID=UPI00364284E9